MNGQQELIAQFYSAFHQKDWQGMVRCYHPDVTFYDPVFQNLDAPRVKAMWEMLCKNAKDLTVTARNIEAAHDYGSCNWTATYTFSATGRKVINEVRALFRFQDGLILEHQDDFDLWKWSRQALGASGLLLGWSPFVQNKVRKNAKRNLNKFMQANSSI